MAKKKKIVEPSLEDKFVVACKKEDLEYGSKLSYTFPLNYHLFSSFCH